MIKYRYFPFLGIKQLEKDEKELYDIPDNRECKALVFEWLMFFWLIVGKVYTVKKEDNGD